MTPVQWLSIKETGVRHLHTIQSAIMRGNWHMSSHDYGAVLKVKPSCLLCHTPCVHGAEQTLYLFYEKRQRAVLCRSAGNCTRCHGQQKAQRSSGPVRLSTPLELYAVTEGWTTSAAGPANSFGLGS